MRKATLMGLMAAFCLAALPVLAADKKPVKIGVMAPVTGNWASEGQDMVNIVKLLAEDVNAAGGVKGRMIEIEVGDDGGDPKTATLAAQRLIGAEVVAVIGTYGSAITEATQDIYADDDVLQIGTGSTSIRLTEKGLPLFFRTCPRDDDQGRVLARHVQDMGFKKAALVHDNSSYAKGLAEEVKGIFAQNKAVEIVFYDAITPGDRDYTTTLTKVKTLNPDIIIFTGYYPEAGMLLRQKTEMQWMVPMIGGDATNNMALVDIAGSSAKGYYFVSPPGPSDMNDPMSKEVLGRYKAKFNALPSSVWAMMAGDAFKVLMVALENIDEPTSQKLADYLHNDLKGFVGFTGPIAFDAKGDRVGDVYRLYKVDDEGQFALLP